jgi:hypothetical protein
MRGTADVATLDQLHVFFSRRRPHIYQNYISNAGQYLALACRYSSNGKREKPPLMFWLRMIT